jgi:hypothetical protein
MQLTVKTAVMILSFCAGAIADQCARGSQNIGGNWYCQAVKAVQYSGVGKSGSYNQVTGMDASGHCSSQPKAYSGGVAPLNEEVSLHFRGPLRLKQVAAYTKTGSASKRDVATSGGPHARRHNHAAMHKRNEEKAKRADWVTATIDGQVVSWENNYFGEPTPGAAAPVAAAPVVPAAAPAAPTPGVAAPVDAAPVKAKAKAQVDPNAAYQRIGYYDAASGTLDGLTFLGHTGGQGSGVWDGTYGSSLGYLNAQGTGGAASSTVLADTLIPSNAEFAIFTDKSCSDGGCGFYRPGSVAYHGFDGADKVFLFEFGMPKDGSSGFNADMPAIWMLNAQIPRTLQYGDASCSCWTTGCGEFDIIETLASGEDKCKSTLHTNNPGGSSDYFQRPVDGTMKLAVIMSSADNSINVQVLPASTDFSASLTASEVNSFLTAHSGNDVSTFVVA